MKVKPLRLWNIDDMTADGSSMMESEVHRSIASAQFQQSALQQDSEVLIFFLSGPKCGMVYTVQISRPDWTPEHAFRLLETRVQAETCKSFTWEYIQCLLDNGLQPKMTVLKVSAIHKTL